MRARAATSHQNCQKYCKYISRLLDSKTKKCCGLIETDTSERVIRSIQEVSHDDRETPDVDDGVQGRGGPPGHRTRLRCGGSRQEFGPQCHYAPALETGTCRARTRGVSWDRASVPGSGGMTAPA